MKNIRNKVFETNSSSTHSISISEDSDGILDTLPVTDGTVTLTGGEFGWEWNKFNDSTTKANYAAVFAQGDEKMEPMLVKVLKLHTGAKKVEFDFTREWKDPSDAVKYSYIDHQSDRTESGDAFQAFESPEKLKNWIFNPASWLFTGNDNDSEPPNFFDVGDKNYKFELCIEGVELTEAFEEKPDGEKLEDSFRRLMSRHPLCDYNYKNDDPYYLLTYQKKDLDGKEIFSFGKLKEGSITVYKYKSIYSQDKKAKYLGDKLLAEKDIKFCFKEL